MVQRKRLIEGTCPIDPYATTEWRTDGDGPGQPRSDLTTEVSSFVGGLVGGVLRS
jgi:hypothetical protein